MAQIKIFYKDIPDYLKNGEFFEYLESVDTDSDSVILDECYYTNLTTIRDFTDFKRILECVRFWCVNTIPFFVYDYILANKVKIKEEFEEIKEIIFSLKQKDDLMEFIDSDMDTIVLYLILKNKIDFLEYFISKNVNFKEDICDTVAMIGNVEIFKLFHENGYKITKSTLFITVSTGKLDILKYIDENEKSIDITGTF